MSVGTVIVDLNQTKPNENPRPSLGSAGILPATIFSYALDCTWDFQASPITNHDHQRAGQIQPNQGSHLDLMESSQS